jgi:redox-sensing transcriptional repressor
MRYQKIPSETIRRLPLYLRGLMRLRDDGKQRISSKTLADYISANAWQIRKDFSYFGGFGKPGVGYDIGTLIKQISKVLKLESGHRAALVGVGNLGSAVLAYQGFKDFGLEIVSAFDVDENKIGSKIAGIKIEEISNIPKLGQRNVDLGIITVPERNAQEIADLLVEAGVRGILNFSPMYLSVPKRIKVITIDIAIYLASLPYYIPR